MLLVAQPGIFVSATKPFRDVAAFWTAVVYLWIMMILLGAVALETFMIYPNIFAHPPASLTTALEFMQVTAPHDFFPPLGFASWVSGATSVAFAWRVRSARPWLIFSLAMIVADGLISMFYQWPRNEIMFVEGPAVHAPSVLVETARQFQRMHWSRLITSIGAAVGVFVGFLRLYRSQLLAARNHYPRMGRTA